MREKIFNIIEPYSETTASKIYDNLMIVVIAMSLIPLLFRTQNFVFDIFELVSVTIFSIDYILRLITADYKLKNHSVTSFMKYPFTPMAIIDLLTILPSLTPLHNGFKALRILRLFRALRVIRILRYSKSIQIINDVFEKEKKSLGTVLVFAISYVFITALIMFQVEPQTFDSYYDACYWATISLTTVGYGDIYAVTKIGQFFTMLSAFVGIAIVALPAGIITAGYLGEVNARKRGKDKRRNNRMRQRKRQGKRQISRKKR